MFSYFHFYSGSFRFVVNIGVDEESGKTRDVELCEGAYVAMLGYGTTSPSAIGSLWRCVKRNVIEGTLDIDKELRKKGHCCHKLKDAKAFILNYALHHSEFNPSGSFYTAPFFSRTDFYREYEVGSQLFNFVYLIT